MRHQSVAVDFPTKFEVPTLVGNVAPMVGISDAPEVA